MAGKKKRSFLEQVSEAATTGKSKARKKTRKRKSGSILSKLGKQLGIGNDKKKKK